MKRIKQCLAVAALSAVGFSAHAADTVSTKFSAGVGTGHIDPFGVRVSDEFSYGANLGFVSDMDKIKCGADIGVTGSNGLRKPPSAETQH